MSENCTRSYWQEDVNTLMLDSSFCLGYVVVVCAVVVCSVTLNSSLMLIILKSSTLNTQPNTFLVSVCVNGIVAAAAACLDAANVYLASFVDPQSEPCGAGPSSSRRINGFHNTLLDVSLCGYCCTLLVVSYYKCCVAQDSCLSVMARRRLVIKSLILSWSIALLLGLLYSVSWLTEGCASTRHPGLLLFNVRELSEYTCPENARVKTVAFGVEILHYSLMVVSAVTIGGTLQHTIRVQRLLPSARSRRVVPQKQPCHDEPAIGGVRKQEETTLSHGAVQPNVYAFILSESGEMRGRGSAHLFTVQNHRRLSQRRAVFTDLSKQRSSPDLLNDICSASSSKYSTGRGRRGHAAVRNLIVMIIMFTSCSLPLAVVAVPYATAALTPRTRIYLTLAVKCLFYLHSAGCPLWYFVFSPKYKKRRWRRVET